MNKLILALSLSLAPAFAATQAPVPPPELKKLDWMLGSWTGKVKWTMPGMSGDASMKFTGSMEGMFQKQVGEMTMDGQTTLEVSYLGYDPKKKAFMSWTFTNFAPTPRVERITIKGNKLSFMSEPWDVGMPGGPTVSRATMIRNGDSATLRLEFKMGGKWTKVGSGVFRRVAAQSNRSAK